MYVRSCLPGASGHQITSLHGYCCTYPHRPLSILVLLLLLLLPSPVSLPFKLPQTLKHTGKSTLINAFLANEILPVNNVPETARICRINHTPTASCPEPLLELTAASGPSGTSRSSSLASAGSAAFDSGSSSLGTSPSTDGGLAARISTSSSTATEQFAGGDCTEVLVGAAAIRQHLQQLNRDVRAREHMRNDEKVRAAVGFCGFAVLLPWGFCRVLGGGCCWLVVVAVVAVTVRDVWLCHFICRRRQQQQHLAISTPPMHPARCLPAPTARSPYNHRS